LNTRHISIYDCFGNPFDDTGACIGDVVTVGVCVDPFGNPVGPFLVPAIISSD